MSIVTIQTDNSKETIDLQKIQNKSHLEQIKLFNDTDKILLDVNKNKHQTAKEIITYIKSIRSPEQIDMLKITLFALMDFFQKTYVNRTFKVNLSKIPDHIVTKLEHLAINIISKANNFPHLIGVSGIRNDAGEVVSRLQPKNFLDGVMYQFLLLNYHDNFSLDLEKLDVFPWIHQTLSSPTYILSKNAINTASTKFDADIIFIRKIFNSAKYAYHIVGLKNEHADNFSFKSQFAIKIKRQYRIHKMFHLKKAVYDFYRDKMSR